MQNVCRDQHGYQKYGPLQHTVYPKKYAHGFVVLCFVVVLQSFIMNSYEVFLHIHQGCFAGTGAIVRLPQCQWSKPDGYGKISQCITTTKHSKAKTVCIFLGIYCIIKKGDEQTRLAKTIYKICYDRMEESGIFRCQIVRRMSKGFLCVCYDIRILHDEIQNEGIIQLDCHNRNTISYTHPKEIAIQTDRLNNEGRRCMAYEWIFYEFINSVIQTTPGKPVLYDYMHILVY